MTINYYTYEDEYGRMHTVATTHYAGKKVRATAQCSLNDTYDREYGEKLAALRLEKKCCEISLKLLNKELEMRRENAHREAAIVAKEEADRMEKVEHLYVLDEQIGKMEE